MNRRNFMVATGTATIGSSLLYRLKTQPTLALQSDLGIQDEINYTIRNSTGEGFEQLNIVLDTFQIESNNIDKENITIEMKYKINNNSENTFKKFSLSEKTEQDVEQEHHDIIANDTFDIFETPREEGETKENNIKIIIKVMHDEVPDVEVESDFKLNIFKEIIENIKLLTTNNKIDFPEKNVSIEDDGDTAIGIVDTGVTTEMTTIE